MLPSMALDTGIHAGMTGCLSALWLIMRIAGLGTAIPLALKPRTSQRGNVAMDMGEIFMRAETPKGIFKDREATSGKGNGQYC